MKHFNTRSTLFSRSQRSFQKLLKAGAAAMLLLGPTVAFSQVCGPINTFPYTENFDGVTAPDLPCGWDTLNVNADNRSWKNESVNPSSAPNAMVYRYSIQNPADDWFFSRAFTLDASKLYVVTFNHRMQSAAYPEK